MLRCWVRNLLNSREPDTERLQDAIRDHRRSIGKSIRMLSREENRMYREENEVLKALRSQAAHGAIDRIQTRQLLALRRRRNALLKCKGQLNAADFQVLQQQTAHELHGHIQRCSEILLRINRASGLKDMQSAVQHFTSESQKLGLMDELMAEALEDGAAAEHDNEEDEALVMQEILDATRPDAELAMSPQRKTQSISSPCYSMSGSKLKLPHMQDIQSKKYSRSNGYAESNKIPQYYQNILHYERDTPYMHSPTVNLQWQDYEDANGHQMENRLNQLRT